MIASRPSAIATSTSSAATHERIVGTSDPVSRVYPTAASAPAPAATSGNRQFSASVGLSASSRSTRNIVAATTAVMCSPLTDSKCASPERRIASASSSPTPP